MSSLISLHGWVVYRGCCVIVIFTLFKVIKYLFNHPDVTNRGHSNIQQNLMHKKFCYVRMWNLDKPGFGIVLNQARLYCIG